MTPGRTRCGQRFCGRPSPCSGLAHSSGTPWPSSPRCQPLSKEPPQVSRQRAPSAPVESRDVDPCGHLDPSPCGREGALPGAVARLPPAEIRAPRTAGPLTVTAPAGQSVRRPRLRVPTPWSRPPEGRLANRSPGTQAGAEPERARVPQKCERVGLNRWMANRSARVRDAWGGGTGPWLESGSQLP